MRLKYEEEMKALMSENERQMIEIKKTYEDKLKEKEALESHYGLDGDREKVEIDKRDNPYLSNLNFDEQLCGKIIYLIRKGVNNLGKSDNCSIKLYGPSIQDNHGRIYRKDNDIVILERVADDCRILLNGDPVINKVHLNHNDR